MMTREEQATTVTYQISLNKYMWAFYKARMVHLGFDIVSEMVMYTIDMVGDNPGKYALTEDELQAILKLRDGNDKKNAFANTGLKILPRVNERLDNMGNLNFRTKREQLEYICYAFYIKEKDSMKF